MKQFNLQMPDWKNVDWKSPIFTVSVISVVMSLLMWIFPIIQIYGAIGNNGRGLWVFLTETMLYSFLHGWFWHLISNIIFFIFIGKIIEYRYGQRWTWYLWWWTTVFVGAFLFIFSDNPTIGGSGFAMSLLAVYAYDFYKKKQTEDLKWALLLLFINLIIGMDPSISFIGHLAGAIAWFIYIWHKHNHSHLRF